ncbi:recombinase family protein [Paenibacillus forsythiae]
MVVEEVYGQYRLVKLLNEKGFKTAKGKPWSASAANVVLNNPWCKDKFR